jgi:hypothetical protein
MTSQAPCGSYYHGAPNKRSKFWLCSRFLLIARICLNQTAAPINRNPLYLFMLPRSGMQPACCRLVSRACVLFPPVALNRLVRLIYGFAVPHGARFVPQATVYLVLSLASFHLLLRRVQAAFRLLPHCLLSLSVAVTLTCFLLCNILSLHQ